MNRIGAPGTPLVSIQFRGFETASMGHRSCPFSVHSVSVNRNGAQGLEHPGLGPAGVRRDGSWDAAHLIFNHTHSLACIHDIAGDLSSGFQQGGTQPAACVLFLCLMPFRGINAKCLQRPPCSKAIGTDPLDCQHLSRLVKPAKLSLIFTILHVSQCKRWHFTNRFAFIVCNQNKAAAVASWCWCGAHVSQAVSRR